VIAFGYLGLDTVFYVQKQKALVLGFRTDDTEDRIKYTLLRDISLPQFHQVFEIPSEECTFCSAGPNWNLTDLVSRLRY